jgi:hypothetical protein
LRTRRSGALSTGHRTLEKWEHENLFLGSKVLRQHPPWTIVHSPPQQVTGKE